MTTAAYSVGMIVGAADAYNESVANRNQRVCSSHAGKSFIDMPKKLAITVSGAVSLGSYESGVLYEILSAIAQHNQAQLPDSDNRIEVDVLTGASAGGMTAIILSQKLLFGGGEFKGPYDNPLYNTWVKRISLEGLQDTGDDEPALHSLFSSNLIETISQEQLTARYHAQPKPDTVRYPAAASAIRVGVALSNLNGLAYGYQVQPDGTFIYIDYCDQRTRFVDSADPQVDTEDFWEPLRQAAVACGAFPIAFRAQDVVRYRKTPPDSADYQSTTLQPWDQEPMTFTYSDGGILQNEPLGLAKNLVDLIDNHVDDNRFYLFVSPHAKDPKATNGFHEANADYFRMIERLLGVVVGQSGFQDWITALGVNERISKLDNRASELKDVILAGEIDLGALEKTAASLLSLFFPGGSHIPPGANTPESLEDAKKRIAAQYASEINELAGIPGAAPAFRDSILSFESAAGLGARDCMTIYGVTATDTELAGAGLQAFLGFFDQKFRDHDYDVGRTHARALLNNEKFKAGPLGPIQYDEEDIHPIDTRLNGLKLSQVPAADINQFKTGLKHRLNQMLKESIHGWLAIADPVTEQVSDRILDALIDQVIVRN